MFNGSAIGGGGDLPFVVVGAESWCDYITDGTDDAVQIQAAIDAVYASGASGGKVILIPGNYNIGAYTITIYPSVTLEGANDPFQKPDHGWTYANPQVARINVTSTTSAQYAVLLKTASTIRNIQFHYPNQLNTASPITYPATIKVDTDAYVVTIENIQGGNCWYFLDASATHNSIIVNRVFAFPIYRGIYEDLNYDVSYVSNVHFNPNYATGFVPSVALCGYVRDNSIAFEIHKSDCSVYTNLFAFGYYKGFVITDNTRSTFINPQADACLFPFILTRCYRVTIDGGWAYNVDWINSNWVLSGNWGIYVDASYRCVIKNCMLNVGQNGIKTNSGSYHTIEGNVVEGFNGVVADNAGIFVNSPHSIINGNTVICVVAGTSYGIRIYTAAYCSVVGNTIKSCNTSSVLYQSSDYCSIIGNTAENCPDFTAASGNTVVGYNTRSA
jgi:parallel beta-helix repeat protein